MEENKFDPLQFIGFLLISAILMFWFYDNQSNMIENQQEITQIYKEQSYDELKEVLHNYLNPSDTDSNETGDVGNTSAAKDDGLDKVVDEKTEKNSDVEAAFDDLFNS